MFLPLCLQLWLFLSGCIPRNALIVDEITIRFNEITMMDIWDDYEGDADEIMEDSYFIDTMSIDVYPKLPNGMYQFSL